MTNVKTSFGISLALMVHDIAKARRFYEKLGFSEMMAIQDENKNLAASILQMGTSNLILGPVDDPHYYSRARAKKVEKGPRGLGSVILINVPDLDKIYKMVKKEGLEILLEPMDEFYGDRIFMFLDEDGYEWKVHQPIKKIGKKGIAQNLKGSGYKVR